MTSFEEVMEETRLMSNKIISEMIYEKNCETEILEFSSYLLTTKQWFVRLSWAHKKQFMLSLIDDLRSLRTLCLLLKSIWNCRPKDAVMSACQPDIWSCYDQVPMDHDRTLLPLSSVKNAMLDGRKWFRSLKPELQIIVLTELLSIAGGPIMWEVLQHSKHIYEKHIEDENQNLVECVVINEPPAEKKAVAEPVKKEQALRKKSSFTQVSESKQTPIPGQALKEYENNLAIWASTIKTLKDSMKLEELELIHKDGSRRRMWKANRTKPEAIDTVDFIQMLPSTIGKRIFSYLPSTQLSECARVNKYWSYLVDEMRAEVAARQKIDVELEKLRENMLRHDASLILLDKPEFAAMFNSTSKKNMEVPARVSAFKSKKYCADTLKLKKKNKSKYTVKPIRNMTEFNELLERRGAADQNLWTWCENLLKIYSKFDKHANRTANLQGFDNFNILCPISDGVEIPLSPPLVVDPTVKSNNN